MPRDYSKGHFITVVSQEQMRRILETKKTTYDAKAAVRQARKELRKQGLKV